MEDPFLSQCRICFDSYGELISPCNCSGTLKYIHIDCLQKWRKTLPFNVFNNKRDIQCEICQTYYEFEDSYEEKSYNLSEYSIICLEILLYIIILHTFGFLLGILITWFGTLPSMIFIDDINIYLYQYLLGNAIVHIITGTIILCYILSLEEDQVSRQSSIICCLMTSSDTSNSDDCCIVIMLFICISLTMLGIYYWALKRSEKRQQIKSDNRIVKNLELTTIL